MLFATLCGATMQLLVRLVSGGLHPFEIGFFRFFMGLLAFLPVLARQGLTPLRTRRLGLHAIRAALQCGSIFFVFSALAFTPLATVAAMQFTWPLFGLVLVVSLLGEKVTTTRIAAFMLGLAGCAIIIRPGMGTVHAGALLALGGSALFGAVAVTVKILARTETNTGTAFYLSLLATPLAFAAALPFWQTPTPYELTLMAGVGVLGSLANVCFTQALKDADAAVIMPLDFTKMIWAALQGIVFFAEWPDGWTWGGAALIVVSSTWLTVSERQQRQAMPTGT
jgi:drug/metabolite transporter (DMT)-like permease